MKKIALCLCTLALLLAGCMPQTKTGQGTLYGSTGGAVAGAVLGQVIGGDTEGTLWGAAIGAALGGAAGAGVGKMMDNQERDMRAALAASEAATIRREGNLLSILFKSDLTFDFDSATIRPGLYAEIDRIAEIMRQYPQTLIRVEGHTDSTGSEQYNMELSQRRARAVADLLVQRQVSSSRIERIGFGEGSPIATNETESGRMMNRRVEIKIAPATGQ
ncbi:MAG: OmpA family protein [Deltaproteobacteria bacterium]|nr:OmpA family protein [Candidatus Anaeroferrophillus wilburensis]MBN2888181.1 OmpA family protein [Deltaproteobacteria bacterium]